MSAKPVLVVWSGGIGLPSFKISVCFFTDMMDGPILLNIDRKPPCFLLYFRRPGMAWNDRIKPSLVSETWILRFISRQPENQLDIV